MLHGDDDGHHANAAAPGAPDFWIPQPLHRLAFGSCHKSKYADARLWQTIGSHEKMDAFLWTGDAVYPPTRDVASLELLASEYRRLLHDPAIGYQQFVERLKSQSNSNAATIWGTWDDHDYGGNDRGADMLEREARAALYWDLFLKESAGARAARTHGRIFENKTKREGLYYSVEWRAPAAEEDGGP